jgi:hypothetical protein
VSVKEYDPLNSMKFQNPAFFTTLLTKNDWKDLTLKAICKLVVSFVVDYINLFFFSNSIFFLFL